MNKEKLEEMNLTIMVTTKKNRNRKFPPLSEIPDFNGKLEITQTENLAEATATKTNTIIVNMDKIKQKREKTIKVGAQVKVTSPENFTENFAENMVEKTIIYKTQH